MNRGTALLLGAALALCEGSCGDSCSCHLRDISETAKPADATVVNDGVVPDRPTSHQPEDEQNPDEGFDSDESETGAPIERACDDITPTGTSVIAKIRDIWTATRACCLEVVEHGVRDDVAGYDVRDDRNLRFRLSREGTLDRWCQCAMPTNPGQTTYADGFCAYSLRRLDFGDPEFAYFVSTGPDGLCDGKNVSGTRSNFVVLCERSEGTCRVLENSICLDPLVRPVDATAGVEVDFREATRSIEEGRDVLDSIRSAARRRP